MNHRVRLRPVAALATLVLAISAGLATAPAVAQSAAERCVPPGEPLTHTSWATSLLAPKRIWPYTDGSGQRVAVVSTGVEQHPRLPDPLAAVDLAPVDPNRRQTSGRTDCLGVGTGTAGLIVGRPHTDDPFAGVSPGADLLSAKVVGDQYPINQTARYTVDPDVLARAIDWAVEQDADVIVTTELTLVTSAALTEAVTRAAAADVVLVAAVGEPTTSDDRSAQLPSYPAAYPEVIGVAAMAETGAAEVSRPHHVDLVAPGVDLLTTYPRDGWGPAGGSSFAAGYVAATAALVRAYHPDLSAADVTRRLLATATPAPEGVGSPRYGYGIVSPYQAVLQDLAEGAPAPLPIYTTTPDDPETLAQQRQWQHSHTLAIRLSGLGLGAALLLAAVVVFGPKGRRRRWRAGLAPIPVDHPMDGRPEPPVPLFPDRQPGTQK